MGGSTPRRITVLVMKPLFARNLLLSTAAFAAIVDP
jgi:hypothetical protein